MTDALLAPPEPGTATAHRRGWTLTVACLGVLLVMSSMVALNTALGDIAIQTSASQTQLTWIVDGYTLALACLLLPAGAIGDRFGRRGALLFGLVLFGASSFLPIFVADATTLIVSRGIAGLGAAFVMPATLSLITSVYSRQQRTKAVGVWAGVSSCGGIVGMLGSGVLLHFWSWPSIFWAFALSATLLIPLTLLARGSKEENPHPLDGTGAALIAAAVAAFVFG
ncbi:MAG TPA: MFS transporter, partial [Mycobacterium sp.]|nr:MFS transporter [Mycobacterium sp.]